MGAQAGVGALGDVPGWVWQGKLCVQHGWCHRRQLLQPGACTQSRRVDTVLGLGLLRWASLWVSAPTLLISDTKCALCCLFKYYFQIGA